ncbi:hypothetical protein K469DRAFT_684029 [Zopfia rhizophila CBS 207.26]|uniref:BTB domain-containing protein n=1 Tax=Zopfia rhizophila CBS 207.26 TaxID=1314779 RepID=A0A6A6DCH9_9PEZI|nr:hypothetical protein K469DRAFT_684029 [Zopfia rhizophila CBS 207.26]
MENNNVKFVGRSQNPPANTPQHSPPETSQDSSKGTESSKFFRVSFGKEEFLVSAERIAALPSSVNYMLNEQLWEVPKSQYKCPDKNSAEIFRYLHYGEKIFHCAYPKHNPGGELKRDCFLYCFGKQRKWPELSEAARDRICKYWPDTDCALTLGRASVGEVIVVDRADNHVTILIRRRSSLFSWEIQSKESGGSSSVSLRRAR